MRHWIKSSFNVFRYNIAANYRSLYKLFLRLFFKPKEYTLEHLAHEYSKTVKPVHFLQVGANDGFYHDPLFKFILLHDWHGILLEPQPFVYREFLQRLHRNAKGIVAVNAALAPVNGKIKMYKIAFSNSRWATGLTSMSREAVESAISSGHVTRLAKRYGEPLPASLDQYIDDIEIEAINAETLFARYPLPKIDWLQIDAEGFDFEIIKLMNISKTQPKVIAFENTHFSSEDKIACERLLTEQDYVCTQFGENTVAMKKPLGNFAHFFNSKGR